MENNLMNNRVFGVAGVCATNSNMNADFNGNPRRLPSGELYASDKSFKYPVRFYFKSIGKKVFNMRSDYFKTDTKKNTVTLVPRTLKENYENSFNVPDLSKVKNTKEVTTNLFSCIDVKQFGATFAESGNNVGIKGAVQIYQGINIYEDATEEYQTILSPYKNPNENNKKAKTNEDGKDSNENSEGYLATTLGTNVFIDEAHFVFPFTINPLEYQSWIEEGVTNGYTKEDYELLKDGINRGVTALDTASKAGCENEYSVFIKVKENENLYLPNLSKYVTFTKVADGKDVITLGFDKMLNSVKSKIDSVEVYYNELLLDIEFNFENTKYMDIVSYEDITATTKEKMKKKKKEETNN